tara:strand:- start:1384 stop:2148 length:765 start_codon:yes stop_codon:yes gene_type:complete
MEKKKIIFAILFILLISPILFFTISLTERFTENSSPNTIIHKPMDTEVINTKQPIFEWVYKDKENDPQKEVLIQVAKTKNFENPHNIYLTGTKTKSKTNKLFEGGLHYVRIQTKDQFSWGEWSEVVQFTIDPIKKQCEDLTPYYTCSINKPLYCEAGDLIENCNECGCSEGYECADNTCEKIIVIETCEDGTYYNSCNEERKYCNEGVLENNCNICGGCSEGEKCIDNKCEETKPSFKDVLITIGKFVKNKVGL